MQNIPAETDTAVQGGGDSGQNFGTEAMLRVKNTPSAANQMRESYIRYGYDSRSIMGEVVNVQLIVNSPLNPRGPLPVSVFVADNA